MARYYFITTLLPPLKLGASVEMTSRELDFFLKLNVSKEDLERITVLRRKTDIENIRHFWLDESLDPGGNIGRKAIEACLFHHEFFPSYVFYFMEKYETKEERLDHFPELLHAFFKKEIDQNYGFVKDYLTFEREWRLVMTALRAKALQRNFDEEFAFENKEDPFIAAILDQKNEPSYHPPEAFFELKELFEKYQKKPLLMLYELSLFRFNHIEKMAGDHLFDAYRVLAYVVQLEIVETWLKLDKKQGLTFIESVTRKGVQ